MSLFDTSKSIIQQLDLTLFEKHNVGVFVKRDDLIDPFVSGNKWRKLEYNVANAISLNKKGIATPGGAYSNHLLATAAACQKAGLRSIGIVRGEELTADSNANLRRCADFGMELHFVSRSDYAERSEPFRQEYWKELYYDLLFVPEGGANYYGLIGCQKLGAELKGFDHIFVAQGTTATSCGILLGTGETCRIHVVPVLKRFDAVSEMRPLLYQLLGDSGTVDEYISRTIVHADYHFGGYGKWNAELENFAVETTQKLGLPLDLVYTAKAFFALMETVRSGKLDGSRICFVHTGGLMNA